MPERLQENAPMTTHQTTARVADDLDLLTARALVSLPDPLPIIQRLTPEEWRAVVLSVLQATRLVPTSFVDDILTAASAPTTPPPRSPA